MKFGSKSAIEPRSVQFEVNGQTVEVTQLPGKKPHFVIEHEKEGKWDRVVVDPAQVVIGDSFGSDAKKLHKFFNQLDGEIMETIQKQLQEQSIPEDKSEREVYYAALALFHTPASDTELKEIHKKMHKGAVA